MINGTLPISAQLSPNVFLLVSESCGFVKLFQMVSLKWCSCAAPPCRRPNPNATPPPPNPCINKSASHITLKLCVSLCTCVSIHWAFLWIQKCWAVLGCRCSEPFVYLVFHLWICSSVLGDAGLFHSISFLLASPCLFVRQSVLNGGTGHGVVARAHVAGQSPPHRAELRDYGLSRGLGHGLNPCVPHTHN
jgi:hypothetical protein